MRRRAERVGTVPLQPLPRPANSSTRLHHFGSATIRPALPSHQGSKGGWAVTAGASAGYAADRLRLEASEYERLAKCAREGARRYELAQRTEASGEARLQALGTLGWRVLADRRWAGSKRANVDLLLIGPGGVVVADVKAWRALQVRNDSLFCEDECRDDEVGKLLGLTDQVQDSVGLLGLTRQALWPALVFAGRRLSERAAGVDLVGEANVAAWVSRLGRRLDED